MKIIFNLRYCWQDFGTKNKISIVADFVLATSLLVLLCPQFLEWCGLILLLFIILSFYIIYTTRYGLLVNWYNTSFFMVYTLHMPSTLYETLAHLSGVYRIIIVMWPQRCNTQERTQNKKKDPFIILFIYSQHTLSCEIECFAMLCAQLSACI